MPKPRVIIPVRELRRLYAREGRSLHEVAVRLDVNRDVVRTRLRELGIPVRSAGEQRDRELRTHGRAYEHAERLADAARYDGAMCTACGLEPARGLGQRKPHLGVECARRAGVA